MIKIGKCGENLTWLLSGETLVISGTGTMTNYFTTFIFRMPIWRGLYGSPFKNIIIKCGVTSIGNSAFYACTYLTTITIPESVIFIGNEAFGMCDVLPKITIPASVKTIGNCAFYHCKSLKSVTIPDGVKTIGVKVFYSCDSLKEIYYPAGRGFEDKLRQGNNAQLIPYTNKPPVEPKPQPVVNTTPQPVSKPITQSVTKKLRWKVEGNTLTVGGVREIKDYSRERSPWDDKLRVIQKIIIEDGVEKISARAFEDCTRLEQLTIPASVKTIGDFAFTYCYCGDRKINNGKNVIWSLEAGVLMIKKNPAAKSDVDFSTGYPTWEVAEKNITGVKIERGIVPGKRFFDWLARMGNSVNVSF